MNCIWIVFKKILQAISRNRKIEIIDFLRSYFSKKTYAEIYGHKDLIQIEIRDYINEKILTQSRIREIIFIKLELLHL